MTKKISFFSLLCLNSEIPKFQFKRARSELTEIERLKLNKAYT